MSPAATAHQPVAERRHHVRVTFSPVRRPRLHLEDRIYEVLDASLGGLRVRHADLARPALGSRITGNLHWMEDETPLPIRGTVVRVQPTEFALTCDEGILPIAHILSESARRRDLQSDTLQ